MTRKHHTRFRLTVTLVVATVLTSAHAEWKESVLYSFQGGSDGSTPAGGVAFDKQGNLYGATTNGGAANCPSLFQCGTVFELSPPARPGDPWTETVLWVFKGGANGDGASPFSGVIMDSAGNLYGATSYGGAGTCIVLGTNVGCGTVYELSPPAQQGEAWTEKVLYSFKGDKDGQLPYQDLVFDKAGNLYGATQYGGGYGSCNAPFYKHCGTVFKLSPPKAKGGKWIETLLHSFTGGKDGANPNGRLVFGDRQAISGTTFYGGNRECKTDAGIGCGVVFQLAAPDGSGDWAEKVLHRFSGREDGGQPSAGLVTNQKGSLFGVAGGGTPRGGGIVFQLTVSKSGSWFESVLHWFSNSGPGAPVGPLLFDIAGNMYGTTIGGDSAPDGTVFRMSPSTSASRAWGITDLYKFKGDAAGRHPAASLIFDGQGSLYSTTQLGGTGQSCQGGCGTIFRIQPRKPLELYRVVEIGEEQ